MPHLLSSDLCAGPEAAAPRAPGEAPLAAARRRTDELFDAVRPEAMRARPVRERHRLVFYLGHLEAFDWNLLAPVAGLEPFRADLDRLFAFGIDPASGALPDEPLSAWPPPGEIHAYVNEVRMRLDHRLQDLGAPDERLASRLQAAIEHRLMHAETLAWLLVRLPAESRQPPPHEPSPEGVAPEPAEALVPAGETRLGLPRASPGFAWCIERDACRVAVPEFRIDVHDVTNGRFLRFVEAGGYDDATLWSPEGWRWRHEQRREHPEAWRRAGDGWGLATMWGERALPAAWPVQVTQHEAAAFARSLGRHLPSEAQLQRAAYGDSEAEFPWGDEPPDASRGVFDFNAWDVAPAGSHPRGASPFGVHDLLGNGWEWTRTTLAPLPGFQPLDFYPGYAQDFFDGEHVVLKGGSPRTAARLLRRSFRNWFRPGTSFACATFRTVSL